MVTTIRSLTEPLPNSFSPDQDHVEFEAAANRIFPEINEMGQQMNAVRDEIISAVAGIDAFNINAEALSFSSTKNYAKNEAAISNLDTYTYRRKTAGVSATDPKDDPTNWVIQTRTALGGADIKTSAVDINLVASDPRFLAITMTAAAMRVILPSAVGMQEGVGAYSIKNIGTYRFTVARNDLTFLCFVYPGQTVLVNLSDNSTAAGKWHVFGQNIQNIYDLNASVQLLNGSSSSFDVAKLTATKSVIAYRKDSDGKLYAKVINLGGAIGVETAIGADANITNVSMCALSATQIAITYRFGTIIRLRIVDVSGDVLTPGGSIDVTNEPTGSYRTTRTTASTSTKILVHWTVSTTNYVYFRQITISGSTPSSSVSPVSSTIEARDFVVNKIGSAKFIVSTSFGSNYARAFMHSETTITGSISNAVFFFDFNNTSNVNSIYCALSDSLGLLFISGGGSPSRVFINVIDTSGLTPVIVKYLYFDSIKFSGQAAIMSAVLMGPNNIYLSWANGISSQSDGITLQYTSDGDIRFGVIAAGIERNALNTDGSVINLSIDATTVLQFTRKQTPEIVCKTIRISDITDSSQIATASASSVVIGGGGGGGGTGADGVDGNTAVIRYATSATGTGFTDVPGNNSYVAIASLPPSHTPVLSDFAGLWHKWDGSPGNGLIYGIVDPTPSVGVVGQSYVNTLTSMIWWNKTTDPIDPWGTGVSLKGDQGFVGGFIYKIWAPAASANPNPGWLAFNSATYSVNTLTKLYISATTARGQNILDIIATMDVDDLLFFQSASTGTEVLYLAVNSVTAMSGGVWYSIDVTYKGGNSLTNDKEYSVGYTKAIGMQQLLNNNVVRYNPSTLELLDKNGGVISTSSGGGGGGYSTGTFAQMRALAIGSWTRKQYMITDYGVRGAGILYRSNGTEAVVDGDGELYNDHPIIKIIFPDSQPTAIANNLGKVQLASVGHGLSVSPAVSVTEPVSINVLSWTGSGAAAVQYKILSIDDADRYTIDLNYNSAYGVPTISQKVLPASTGININVPPLNNYSEVIVSLLPEYASGSSIKKIISYLNGNVFSVISQDSLEQVTAFHKIGFRNCGAKNKQESLFIDYLNNIDQKSLALIRKWL